MKGGIFNDQLIMFNDKSVLKKVNFKSKKIKGETRNDIVFKNLIYAGCDVHINLQIYSCNGHRKNR